MNKLFSLLVMLAVVTIIFFLVKTIVGTIVGIIVAVAIFLLWSKYNRREATTGLIDANLFAYFTALRQGCSHQEALLGIVDSRYPSSEEKKKKILLDFQTTIEALKFASGQVPPEQETQMMVYEIFCEENGNPPEDYGKEILTKIEDAYNYYTSKQQQQR